MTPILLIGAALIIFNISRYGDPFNTGYLPEETFSAILWQGILGQLVSPGRGLLLYCPILILSLGGIIPLLRRARAEAIVALTIIVIHLLLYGKWFMWHGGFAWGPRFMIPTLPFWAIFLAPVAARAFSEKNETRPTKNLQPLRIMFLTLAALGFVPQLLSVLIDFGPFQNALLETDLPLFAPQTFFELQFSPLLKAWGFIQPNTLDLIWAWQGQLTTWLLIILLTNILITALSLTRISQTQTRPAPPLPHSPAPLPLLPYLSSGAALVSLLIFTPTLAPTPLKQAVTALNQVVQPTDAVITNDPEIVLPFAELYKGQAPVLGLNQGQSLPADITRRLNETIAKHPQIWWLPNWLPPDKSGIEQTLLAEGFRARQDSFADQRLLLFAHPAELSRRAQLTDLTFENAITLNDVAYPAATPAGVALPIELHWQGSQTIAEDYHVFIHLLRGDGQMIAQADGQPVHWTRPTSTWAINEQIIDRYGLWIPFETAPAIYQLRVGLYRPTDGHRLFLPDGADAAQFEITIR